MDQHEFMEGAWSAFVVWALKQPEIRAEFTKDSGHPVSADSEAQMRAFIKWVTINYWGLEFTPAAYRASIGME